MWRQYREPVSLSDRVAASLLRQLPPDVGAVAMRRGDCTVVAAEPSEVFVAEGAEALTGLDHLRPGFWAGFLAFELGHSVERVTHSPSTGASRESASVPDTVLARFDARAVIGPDGHIELQRDANTWRIAGSAIERATRTMTSVRGARCAPLALVAERSAGWRSSLTRDDYEARVREVLALLEAGECYQVNLTRRLTRDHALDPVSLYSALVARHPAPHTALLRLDVGGNRLGVVSASPERFLRRAGSNVETRPIKGTAATAAGLRASAKDRAENVMIVDLARNDLGRVCVPGSIHVPMLCAVEAHPGLHHLVSTVRGTLRNDVGTAALVRATFPPASVTGAPKPRVLQAIEELEPVRRGVYCGALGWFDTADHSADLAVAIRTFTMHGLASDGCTHFGVGGGIVADSCPRAEWEETELKAARLLAVASGDGRRSSAAAGSAAGALVAT